MARGKVPDNQRRKKITDAEDPSDYSDILNGRL